MNTIERGYAKRVGAGMCPVQRQPEPAGSKARIHGLTAQIMSSVSLQDVEKDIQSFSGTTIAALGTMVSSSVKRHAEAARLQGPYEELDALLAERATNRGEEVVPHPSQERLASGANSGIASEVLTLATIQHANESGQYDMMSRQGLYASGRVPFSLALLHMTGLRGFTNGDRFEATTLASGESVKVLKQTDISLHPDTGLRITRALPQGAGDTRLDDPWLGCPVTLVKDFVYDLHALTVDAAVDAGLVTV